MYVKVSTSLTSIPELVEKIKREGKNIGCIIIFDGIVRGISKGKKVQKLYYESQKNIAEDMLKRIAQDVIHKYGVEDIIIEHKIGEAFVGDEVLHIIVASPHSFEAITALEELLHRVKTEPTIWKKEYVEGESYWVSTDKTKAIRLIVNGKEVHLNPFVTTLLHKTILSMISVLRGTNISGNERVIIKVFKDYKGDSSNIGHEKIGKN